MPQLIIHAENDGRARVKAEMVKTLRTYMIEALKLRQEQGQVFLYEALPIHRAMDNEKKSIVFVEVKMIEGRSEEMKETFAQGIAGIVSRALELEMSQVLCLFEEYSNKAYIGGK
tara:strand:+ start:540 stop:884 length:345 start_codon:yes stop_codon:yes gene_type:complete